uniref:Uncharacterized protein n=1 Tax=Rhizophora mucronata TaxID=61149 RepID=A0A2P2NM54_RHIMU
MHDSVRYLNDKAIIFECHGLI